MLPLWRLFKCLESQRKPSLRVIFSSLFLAQWPNVLIIYLYHQRRLGKDWINDGLDNIICTLDAADMILSILGEVVTTLITSLTYHGEYNEHSKEWEHVLCSFEVVFQSPLHKTEHLICKSNANVNMRYCNSFIA